MRLVFLMLVLFAVSFAQVGKMQQEILKCEKNCCQANSGEWDSLQNICDINETGPAFQNFKQCDDKCIETASTNYRSVSPESLCCAPGVILFILGGYVTIRERNPKGCELTKNAEGARLTES